ncbi:hypothetical protein niasHS_015229 [Heterodera schachtii]|uniref:Band 7 domain-containing protein n=2 Tax=Heterodera TaxID=34509 RepID=A0ABD2I1L0_HETSC
MSSLERQSSSRSFRPSDDTDSRGSCSSLLICFSYCSSVICFPCAICLSIRVIQQYERAVIFRLGKVMREAAGPGLIFILPCIDDFRCIDMRTTSFDVPPQEVLSKDSVSVTVDAVIYFRVFDANKAVVNVENATMSTQLLGQTTLRNILGTKTLAELLSKRDQINFEMQQVLDKLTDAWGVKVERVDVKDVRLPKDMQRSMAAEAEAAREARAKVVAAEGEKKAAIALRDAAETIAGTPTALQLRYLQTLTTISAERNSTIVFPFPVDFMPFFPVKNFAAPKSKSPVRSNATSLREVKPTAKGDPQKSNVI